MFYFHWKIFSVWKCLLDCVRWLSHFPSTCVRLYHFSVFWPSETVWYASKAPARLHLSAACPLEEGAPVYSHPAHLSGASLGYQDFTCCHHLPHDGKSTIASIGPFFFPLLVLLFFSSLDNIYCHPVPVGAGSGLHPQAAGLVLL